MSGILFCEIHGRIEMWQNWLSIIVIYSKDKWLYLSRCSNRCLCCPMSHHIPSWASEFSQSCGRPFSGLTESHQTSPIWFLTRAFSVAAGVCKAQPWGVRELVPPWQPSTNGEVSGGQKFSSLLHVRLTVVESIWFTSWEELLEQK